MPEPDHAPNPIRIGISACLLGQEVRFDGGHKRDPFLTDTLGRAGRMGAGVPRSRDGPWDAARDAAAGARDGAATPLRMVTTRTGDRSHRRHEPWAARRLEQLARDEPDLCGYVLKKDSPSCGMERVKTYSGERDARTQRPRALRRRADAAVSRLCRSRRRAG